MGVVLGLGVGVGPAPGLARPSPRPCRSAPSRRGSAALARPARPGRAAGRRRSARSWRCAACSPRRGLRRGPGRLAHACRWPLAFARDGRLPPVRGASPVGRGAASASSPRCGRTPSTTSPAPSGRACRSPRRVSGLGRPGTGAAAASRSAPSRADYQVSGRFERRLDRLKAAAGRPGRGPGRRGAAGRPRGRRRRPRAAAAQPLRPPARRRPHPLRARGAAELGGQRRPARGGGALAGAAAACASSAR